MNQSSFVIWDSCVVPNACSLYDLEGVEKTYQLNKGVPRAVTFSSDAAFSMHPDFPNNTLLTDNLINSDLMIVTSQRVKDFLEAQRIPKLEYLPVTILDHKGRAASRDYFIIHPIEPIECIDLAKSQVEWGLVDKSSISQVHHLEIDASKVPPDVELFRPKPLYDIVLVRRELAELIDAQGFSGIRWLELDQYKN